MGVGPALLAIMAVGTAVSAAGQLRAGRAAKKAAGIEAAETERAAGERARIFAREGRQAIGSQAAGFAKAGVRAGEGSPLLLALESADELERGLAEIRKGGQAQADVIRFGGRQAAMAGRIGAAGTILGGTAGFLKTGAEIKRTTGRSPFGLF